jgi:glycerophosphoryl diester phosphodiesterase
MSGKAGGMRNRLFILTDTFRTARGQLHRQWKPMAWWTLLTWLLMGCVLVPFATGVLRRVVFRGDRLMVGHEELLAFLLSPPGLLYILAAAGLTLLGTVFRYAGLFHIITGDLKGGQASARQTLMKLLPDIPSQFRLCLIVAGIGMVLLVPLLSGLYLVHSIWLAEHDLSYYLYARPAEWYYAVTAAGVWTLAWGLFVLCFALRCLSAVPAYLDGCRPVRKALAQSWSMSRGRARHLFGLLLVSLTAWGALRLLVQAVLFSSAAVLVEMLINRFARLSPALMVTALYGLLSFAAGLLISFGGFSFTAAVLTTFYYRDSGLHTGEVPKTPVLHHLPAKAVRAVVAWFRPRRLIPVLVFLFLAGTLFSGWLLRLVPEPRTFSVTAHRAGYSIGSENTLAALEASIEAGADYVEIDVQTTADGVVVVVHDADLMRVAGVPLRVDSVAYAEIAGLVQGADASIPEAERRIATLAQFLERSKGRVKVNIELKYHGPDPRLVPQVVSLVRAHAMEDEVCVMSFDLHALRHVQRLAPELSAGYLMSVPVGDPARLPVDFLAVSRRIAKEPFITQAHRRGKDVHVWQIHTASEMLTAVQRGADNLITGDPALAIQLRDELQRLTAHERLLLLFRPRMDFTDTLWRDDIADGEQDAGA